MVMSVFNVICLTRTRREDSDSESVTQTQTRKHRMPYTQWRCLRPCFHSFLTPTLNESDHKSAENCWQSFYCFFSIPINKAVILLCLGSLLKVFRHFFLFFSLFCSMFLVLFVFTSNYWHTVLHNCHQAKYTSKSEKIVANYDIFRNFEQRPVQRLWIYLTAFQLCLCNNFSLVAKKKW